MSYAKSVLDTLTTIKQNTPCKITIDSSEPEVEYFQSYNTIKLTLTTLTKDKELKVYKIDDIKFIEFKSHATREEVGSAIRKVRESVVINTIGMRNVN